MNKICSIPTFYIEITISFILFPRLHKKKYYATRFNAHYAFDLVVSGLYIFFCQVQVPLSQKPPSLNKVYRQDSLKPDSDSESIN